MPDADDAYPAAPPLDREFRWLADPDRRYAARPRPRGLGPDSPGREYALRRAAALDRAALREPGGAAAGDAERAARELWILDGWDENWEDRPPRAYVRWAYARWREAGSAAGSAG